MGKNATAFSIAAMARTNPTVLFARRANSDACRASASTISCVAIRRATVMTDRTSGVAITRVPMVNSVVQMDYA